MPNLAFEVRIGISAGEPIHEGGDIFGTPVNLAARVMSKADAREIAVSSVVTEMCRGTDLNFNEVGSFELKGFGAQPIYHVARAM
jgi:class 3 adenylate cyclase